MSVEFSEIDIQNKRWDESPKLDFLFTSCGVPSPLGKVRMGFTL
jgi:hypothetical protein